jgi:hypothetical protein
MESLIFYVILYLICGCLFLFGTAIVNGYHVNGLKLSDFFDSLIWPFTIGTYIGLLIRFLVIKRKDLNDK